MRPCKKFLYIGNFFKGYAFAVLRPNIFGISKIVKIDANYRIVSKTEYFTFNHWFNGYLIAYSEPCKGKWIDFWLDSNLQPIPGTDNCFSTFRNYRFHLKVLPCLNVYSIAILLELRPEILQNMQPLEDGKSYFISTNFCKPFLYRPELKNKVVFIKKDDMSSISHLF